MAVLVILACTCDTLELGRLNVYAARVGLSLAGLPPTNGKGTKEWIVDTT